MQANTTYTVRVLTGNAKVFFRHKKLRTPVILNGVFEKELNVIKTQLKKENLKYTIDSEPSFEENFVYKEQTPIEEDSLNEEVKIEELYDSEEEPNSIMDRLLKEEKENE